MYRKSFTYEGKRYYVRGKTEREAITKMILKKQELENQFLDSDMLLRDWAVQCVDTYKKSQKDITKKKYISRMNHSVLEHIGDMPLNKIKSLHCQEVLNLQAENSQRQIDEIYQVLNFLLGKAAENKLIKDNPAKNIVKPTGYKNERRALTDEEKSYFEPLLKKERYRAFALMYYCGCRPSEARECLYEDVIEKDGVLLLHVRGVKTERHTKASDRYVPIPEGLASIIGQGTGYIATATTGKKHSETSFRKAWLQLIKEVNIAMGCETYKGKLIDPKLTDLVPYSLRHTFATALVDDKDMDLRLSAYVLGHSDISTLYDWYTHITADTIVKTRKASL